jgi:hypothetical protein
MLGAQLAGWGNFYVIVGSSGAALIGIQFVVLTLIAASRRRPTAETLHAFATPTVVHLAAALLISAIMCAPWPSLVVTSFALVLCGLGGVVYGAVVIRRIRRQTSYQPVWEDWLWHALLPCGVHTALAVAAPFLRTHCQGALFAIAAAALALLFIGIHNAWDTVIHIVAPDPDGS